MTGQPKATGATTGATKVTKVTGGLIARNASTGRFMQVTSDSGTSKAKTKSESAAKDAARRRHEALQRLANR